MSEFSSFRKYSRQRYKRRKSQTNTTGGKNRVKYLILFILSSPAYANDEKEEPRVVYKQKTEIDFEGVEIDGELVKPQGALLLDRKRAQFNSMIKLRTDFDDLMEDSVEEIK
jgi:hypothetical protein